MEAFENDHGAASTDTPRHVKFDSSGDVLLSVGPSPASTFLVSSKVLSTASSVFKAMFGPNFSEGSSLNERYEALPIPLLRVE
jgi:hypothetical protein